MLVLPGQPITAESTNGTYTRDGIVRSSLLGIASENGVRPVVAGRAQPPWPGAIVIGIVTRLSPLQATLSITVVDGVPLPHGEDLTGVIRVQDVRSTEKDKVKIADCFRGGDVVRGSVISLGDSRSYYISTTRNDWGVIFATSEAGATMDPISWLEMRCPKTGLIEKRKCAKPANIPHVIYYPTAATSTTMPTPLPSPETVFPNDPAARNAYQRVYSLQARHPQNMAILGWMLIHAPSNEGRAQVAQDINAATNNEKVLEVGEYLESYFVDYFKHVSKKHSSTPSTHPSRPELEAVRQEIINGLVPAPTNHGKSKDQALIRDNYRCMLSGAVDLYCAETNTDLQDEFLSNPLFKSGSTECCHILPQYLTQKITTDESKEIPSAILLVLQQFGGVVPNELRGIGIHHLRNIMTLRDDIHTNFDALRIWLEPVEGQEHQYRLGRRFPFAYPDLPDVHNFVTAREELSLPDRRYLALHAACAKVVHMSGAAEFIDKLLRGAEDTKVLSEDGSSSQLLEFMLPRESVTVS
ncbi:HNH endonuclease [Ceratobasidium theobromae]|uniref:HNH endonuclease n=1 Tax=Ceratobasidium theobromae TaxID=1582974 RepID=A0A5N5QAK4_9AGAM|nr:HNH endonuclease [Ceratobasidium theobromae]